MSFFRARPAPVARTGPGVPSVFLMERVPLRCRKGWLPFAADVAGPSIEILREHPGYVQRVQSAGGQSIRVDRR